jgi:rare lipoprotein A
MRPVLAHTLVILSMVTGLGAAHRPDNSSKTGKTPASAVHSNQHKPRVHRPYQVGRASWYGKRFHGKTTASGEPYDMFQFTAAHQQLPLGTMVKVTCLRNGRWVVVRVNDRGPVPRSRIIDLSYGAAQMLGLRHEGVERVRLDLVNPDTMAAAETDLAGME